MGEHVIRDTLQLSALSKTAEEDLPALIPLRLEGREVGAASGDKLLLEGALEKKNGKRELISDMWKKRGATYGEKGA